MNWIILLLLFGCGGCNSGRSNSCGCGSGGNCNNGRGECDSARCACAREAVREAREDVREALRDVREAREREQAVCDGPGMVPPPWQDYPPMPRRDMGCDDDRDCGCNN
ncbi:MAG: hypothetical protein NC517_00845 [Firmicutes bacterium]|nr:hypothetical protein [Bacillota bacterium]